MKIRNLMIAAVCFAGFATVPLGAADFSLMGSYWKTNAAGKTAGGGVILGLPLNPFFAFELRATYFEQLSDQSLQNAFHSTDPVFREKSIQALPLDAGVRLGAVAPGRLYRPYFGGGVSYFRLDSDFGNIQDEVGYYAEIGATVGDDEGPQFFFEGLWRKVTAHVRIDPAHFNEIEDIQVDDHASLKLDGPAVNAGVRWTF